LEGEAAQVSLTWQQLVESLVLIAGALATGYIIERWGLVRLRDQEVFAGARSDKIILKALRGMIITWLTLVGIYIAILSAPFDETTTQSLLQFLQVPFIISVTVFVMRLITGFIDYSSEKRGGVIAGVSLSRSLTSTIILIIGFLIVLQSLGISITPVIAALGITGLAVSLALEETLSNAIAGVYIIFSKQTQPGDYVRMKVDERDYIEGYITDITWRSTKIQTPPWRLTVDEEPTTVIVPNSRMASDIVVIHNRAGREIEMQVEIGVTYGSDLEKVERVTIEVAREVLRDLCDAEPDPLPLVRYRSFSPAGIYLVVVIYGSNTLDQHSVRHTLIKRLYRRYEQEQIVLALVGAADALSISARFTPGPPRPPAPNE
jgi:small-conductance mechanosensitive channel